MFDEFLNQEVKCPYKDGSQLKVARGILLEVKGGFIKIKGDLGTIIINKNALIKMSLKTNKGND